MPEGEIMSIKNKKFGFTLAEALMALLVISLITIASIPVITKKKRLVETTPHGKWMCTRNASGQHIVYGSEANPSGWVVSGDKCQFLVPRGARGFVVSAIGGGGGGGGSSVETEVFSDQNYQVTKAGKYKFFVVGGGGQGGGWDCDFSDRRFGLTGAAGGVAYGEIYLDLKTSFLTLTKGSGGNNGGSWDGAAGTDTVITRHYGYNQQEEIVRARGGQGGGSRQGLFYGSSCRWRNTTAQQGSITFGSSVVNSRIYNNSAANGIKCQTNDCDIYIESKYNQFLDNYRKIFKTPYISDSVGMGGSSRAFRSGNVGNSGYVAIALDTVYVGEGGKAAPNPKISKFYPSFDKRRFDVTIGAGGKGGEKGMAGKPGGETKVGNLFTVQGGDGGETYNPTTTNTTGKYAGGNGGDGSLYIKGEVQTTAKGGYAYGDTINANGQNAKYYGSGGGGAGVSGSTSGTGGNGAPGYVIIEW